MLTGLPPFYSKDREKLFNNIKTGNIKYPSYLSKEALKLNNVIKNIKISLLQVNYTLLYLRS